MIEAKELKGRIALQESYKKNAVELDTQGLNDIVNSDDDKRIMVQKRGKLETGIEYIDVRIYVKPS